jgi:hypothetical protein
MVNNRSNNPGHAGSARAGSQQQAAGQQGGATSAGGVTLTPAEIRRILKQREKNQRRREKRREGRNQVVEVMNQDGGEGETEQVHYDDGANNVPPSGFDGTLSQDPNNLPTAEGIQDASSVWHPPAERIEDEPTQGEEESPSQQNTLLIQLFSPKPPDQQPSSTSDCCSSFSSSPNGSTR